MSTPEGPDRRYNSLPDHRAEQLRDLAEDVADEFSSGGRVEPRKILAAREITCSFGDYGSAFDGALECKNGGFHVYCNLARVQHRRSARARFTLAHELGHYYIDEHRRVLAAGHVKGHPSRCEFESNYLVEREADFFATHLLMPYSRFSPAAQRGERGMSGVLELHEQFGTSITSTAIRYAKCDVMPCAVVKWHSESYGWCWFSDSMYAKRLGRPMDQVEEVPRDSATALALAGVDPADGRSFHQRGGTASFWFSRRASTTSDPILHEQAVSLGSFGALTLLYPDRV